MVHTRILSLCFKIYLRNCCPIVTQTNNLHINSCNNFFKKNPDDNFLTIQTHSLSPNIIKRYYAKSKDIKKGKGKKKVEINPGQLAEVLDVEDLQNQMQYHINGLKEDYIKNLSLRSTTGAIDSIPVRLDGTEYTLQELAQIVKKNPKTIVVKMDTFPQVIPAVLKALEKSGMNLNPQQDGTTLFIPVPKVTKEHRENLSKNAKALFVKCRDSIKDVQNKHIRSVKKQDNISTDLAYNIQVQIGIIGDKYVSDAEKVLDTKQKELLGRD